MKKNVAPKQSYWMKRRRYGWGWTPVTWQGWFFLLFQLGIVFAAALQLPPKPARPSVGQTSAFLVVVALAVASLILVSLRTSPKPRWRWDKRPSDRSNEDF